MAVSERARPAPVALPGRVTITVGIHGDDGAGEHVDAEFASDGALEPKASLTVAEVGGFHEFGVGPYQLPSGALHPGIPQRSFIRAWFDEQQPFISETLRSQMRLVMAGKLPLETAMARIALAFEGSVKQRISRGIPPPLAPSTVLAKGSSKPLIDTGQLRTAIRGRATITTGE